MKVRKAFTIFWTILFSVVAAAIIVSAITVTVYAICEWIA